MRKSILPFSQVPQFSKTDVAYAQGDERLASFYAHTPSLECFQQILTERAARNYPRRELVAALQRQYQHLPKSEIVQRNIEALGEVNTFTIVTAHQPSLLLGPLYFVYKALTTINLAESVETQPGTGGRIVPVFVLGSEDHDIEEVNKANLFGKKLVWEPGETGPVGSMGTGSLAAVLDPLRGILGDSASANTLFKRVERCYQAHDFAAATQALLHEFLGRFGLVVLNMNDLALKKHFIPVIKAELEAQVAQHLVGESIARLNNLGFKAQATPREINLFYMLPGLRERIVALPSPANTDTPAFQVLNTELVFTQKEILEEAEKYPERFSPNVVLRPLYQEMVLPNLAYVGGGGELAYWLERKSLFEHFGVPFPMLVRRHSVLWLDQDAGKKLEKFGFSPAQFFWETESLVRAYVEQNTEGELSLELEIKALKVLFEQIAEKAKAVDPTLEKAVLADSTKAVAGLEHWQSRLVRAEKQKHETTLNQLRALKEKLFPSNGLQERHDNFLPYVLRYGDDFIDDLKTHLVPFDQGFAILEI